jgi:hypothetical protein
MSQPTQMYDSLWDYLKQWCEAKDVRHLKALVWMVVGLVGSQKVSLTEWEPYVVSKAQKAQSYQRRWRRFMGNPRVVLRDWYQPLVMNAIQGWKKERVFLALDTTMLWNEYCMVNLSIVCGGRAVPLLWKVLKHASAAVAFEVYRPLLDEAQELLNDFEDVTLLADRGFPCHDLLDWLQTSSWHWRLRLACDTKIHGALVRGGPCSIKALAPRRGEAKLYTGVGLWEDGKHRCNMVLAFPTQLEGEDFWAVITSDPPSLDTLWEYGFRFCCEELFLDSKSGVFGLEDSRLRDALALERLYLIVAIALLFATQQGISVHLSGLRRQVDTHWDRGLSYLKIGLRWLVGVVHKGRSSLPLSPLLSSDPLPCFPSRKKRLLSSLCLSFDLVSTIICTTG